MRVIELAQQIRYMRRCAGGRVHLGRCRSAAAGGLGSRPSRWSGWSRLDLYSRSNEQLADLVEALHRFPEQILPLRGDGVWHLLAGPDLANQVEARLQMKVAKGKLVVHRIQMR